MKVLPCFHMIIEFAFSYFSWSFFGAGYLCYKKFKTDDENMSMVRAEKLAFSRI